MRIPPLIDDMERQDSGGLTAMLHTLRMCAANHRIPLYLVGGPVRDVLMGLPVRDLDFVVEGDAPFLARHVGSKLGGHVVVHHAFGTASVTLDGDRIDLVTARGETYPHPGSLPKVNPGRIADDLARRDFSINAMAVQISDDRERLLDPHGGLSDVTAGVVRALHAGSFVDDPTRIFRAARYEQRLGFSMEPETSVWVGQAVASCCVQSLTGDRVRHEIERILHEKYPGPPLMRLAGLGVLSQLTPGLDRLPAVERLMGWPSQADPMIYLAALVYPLAGSRAEDLVQRLNMPNSWARVVRDTVRLRELEDELSHPALANSGITRMLRGISEDAIRTLVLVSHSSVAALVLQEYLDKLRHIGPELNGLDLLAMGVSPGPCVGRMLRELSDAKLDGSVETIDDEKRFVREALVQGGDRQVG